jgi:hypothetical protein
MKRTWFVLLCALLLGLAPTTFADDGGFFDDLAELLAQWIESAAGSGDQPTIGPEYPPGGQPASEGFTSDENLPPKSNSAIGDEPEIGPEYPPHG